MKRNAFTKMMVMVAALGLVACTGGEQPNIEFIQDMMESPAIKAQEYDANAEHHRGMRVPPENTAPVGFKPYAYPTDVAGATKDLKNPLSGIDSNEVTFAGMKMYETHCQVCHGHKGEGGEASGSLVSTFMALKPPPLLSDKVRGMSDGQIYHIITMGQGVMGPYASHVPQNMRWQLVSYIRSLQKNAGK